MQVALYLIPTLLGDTSTDKVIPSYNYEVILGIKHFIVENIRTARRFLKQVDKNIDINSLTFSELNKHTEETEIAEMLRPLEMGELVGVISEAGCPAIADPGADVVDIAQRKGLKVIPLVGPSSIILSVMASGFNGQSFAFNGYLPIDNDERIKCLRRLEQKVYSEDQTQIFIETPYRNSKMILDIVKSCRPSTRFCVAAGLTTADEYIKTMKIKDYKGQIPDLSKTPCIFLIYK